MSALSVLKSKLVTLQGTLASAPKSETKKEEKKELQKMPPSRIWQELNNVIQKFREAKEDILFASLNKTKKEKFFIQDCQNYENENKAMPKRYPGDNILRIATYNVNEWRFQGYNLSGAQSVIQALEADIIILQEVTDEGHKEKIDFQHKFEDYKNYFKKVPELRFGNMILYKNVNLLHEPEVIWYKEPSSGEQRGYIKIVCSLGKGKELTVYGTHLDVNKEANRIAEIKEIIEQTEDSSENIIFCGDFNAIRTKDYPEAILTLIKHDYATREAPFSTAALDALGKGFVDCFTFAHLVGPKFTVWSGIVVDFIFLKKDSWNLPIKGCYVYYSTASDHLPVIMDIGLE